jgi:hypothetical protein
MPEAGPPRDQGATQPATDLTATVADIAAFAHTMRDALAVQHEPPSDHPVWGAELREFTAAERRWGIETGPPLPWEQDARYFTMARWEAEVAELPLSPQATCAERQHPEEDWSHPGTSLTKDEQARPWDTLAERLQALQARLEARQQAMAQDHGQEMRV